MKKRNRSRSDVKAKGSKSKRSNYTEDNPNTSELTMLDRMKKKHAGSKVTRLTTDASALESTGTSIAASAGQDAAADTYAASNIAASVIAGPIAGTGEVYSTGSIQPTVKLSEIEEATLELDSEELIATLWKAMDGAEELLPLAIVDSRNGDEVLQTLLDMTTIAEEEDISIEATDQALEFMQPNENDHLKLGVIHAEHIADGEITSHHVSDQSILDHHLAPDSVRTEALADSSVISSKLAPEAIQADHISNLAVMSHHIADQAIRPYHLHEAAVERDALALSAVDGMRLALDAISNVHVQDEAISTRNIQAQAITADKLASDIVSGEHVQENSISDRHLNFTPVRAFSKQMPAIQFGSSNFSVKAGATSAEVRIAFPEAYTRVTYALVATTNVSGCYAVIAEKYKDRAVLKINSMEVLDEQAESSALRKGAVSWIAIG